jgi:hypothetical protein
MPVASGKDRQAGLGEFINVTVKHGNNLVAVFHRQRTPWTEIVLDIDHD